MMWPPGKNKSQPAASELYSAASELSSYTIHGQNQDFLNLPAKVRGKRGLDTTETDSEDVTPTKRAASCGTDDLSCTEGPVFDRVFENECSIANTGNECADICAETYCPAADVEAESQLWMASPACQTPCTNLKDISNLIKVDLEREQKFQANPHYMDQHGPKVRGKHSLESSMRAVTVSWLVELQQGTLFLAVDLLDRFLSETKALPRQHLQLTAVACKMIAAKMEQEVHPSVHDFTNIADHCFQVAELIRMESLILQTLRFRLIKPNAYTMLCLFRQALGLGKRDTAFATYLVELCMLEYKMLQYRASIIAAAAILVVQAITGDLESLVRLSLMSNHHPAVLRKCAEEISSLHTEACEAQGMSNPVTAVKEKFRDRNWHCVSYEPAVDKTVVIFAVLTASRHASLAV